MWVGEDKRACVSVFVPLFYMFVKLSLLICVFENLMLQNTCRPILINILWPSGCNLFLGLYLCKNKGLLQSTIEWVKKITLFCLVDALEFIWHGCITDIVYKYARQVIVRNNHTD